MKKVLILLVVIAVLGGAWLVMKDKSATDSEREINISEEQAADVNQQEADHTITYDGNAFSPTSLTVKKGDTIEIINNSGNDLDFASDPHPVHTGNSELNSGAIAPDGSVTITVTKTGSYGYHNHLNDSHRGRIIVE